ncbi:hypothetical protein C0J52_18800 [Blattella germanica]|nr:hypothetical protein C0J52_18800 [Blattella germanica]
MTKACNKTQTHNLLNKTPQTHSAQKKVVSFFFQALFYNVGERQLNTLIQSEMHSCMYNALKDIPKYLKINAECEEFSSLKEPFCIFHIDMDDFLKVFVSLL